MSCKEPPSASPAGQSPPPVNLVTDSPAATVTNHPSLVPAVSVTSNTFHQRHSRHQTHPSPDSPVTRLTRHQTHPSPVLAVTSPSRHQTQPSPAGQSPLPVNLVTSCNSHQSPGSSPSCICHQESPVTSCTRRQSPGPPTRPSRHQSHPSPDSPVTSAGRHHWVQCSRIRCWRRLGLEATFWELPSGLGGRPGNRCETGVHHIPRGYSEEAPPPHHLGARRVRDGSGSPRR